MAQDTQSQNRGEEDRDLSSGLRPRLHSALLHESPRTETSAINGRRFTIMAPHMSPLSRIPALRGISASMHVIVQPLDFIAHLAGLAITGQIQRTLDMRYAGLQRLVFS